jgi:NAD(P)H-hydrate epimerase
MSAAPTGWRNVRGVPQLPARAVDGHKGNYGTVLVVAGSATMLGAAVLTATAALRGGAGLVQVALPKPLQSLLPLAVPCATTLGRGQELRKALARAAAVVVGPGLGLGPVTRRGRWSSMRMRCTCWRRCRRVRGPLGAAGSGRTSC